MEVGTGRSKARNCLRPFAFWKEVEDTVTSAGTGVLCGQCWDVAEGVVK